MNNLFDKATAESVRKRIAQLRPDSERQWGTMTPAQVAAHCAASLEFAIGDTRPPRMFLGRIIGGMIKNKVLADESPLRRNTPTAPSLIIKDDRDLEIERKRLLILLDRFIAGACTQHPHTFFGPMTPDEWSRLMYKHLDHHLRQFGV